MSAPSQFQLDNARKAVQFIEPPTRYAAWLDQVRGQLRSFRRDLVRREIWGPTSRCLAIPQPAWLVIHGHSTTQQRVYAMLQEIGKGKHNRAAVGGKAAISGHCENPEAPENERTYLFSVALSAVAYLEGLPVTTTQRAMDWLKVKHSLAPTMLRAVGEPRETNRTATTYRLPSYKQVLEARRADPNIATTHGSLDPKRSLQWTNGRANSRRFLTPEQAKLWNCANAAPRPRKLVAPEAAAAPEAVSAPSAATAPTSTYADALVSKPRRQASTVPPDVQARMNEICGRTEAKISTLRQGREWKPPYCDFAPEILANAQALAIVTGATFPPEGLADWCERIFEKSRKKVSYRARDQFGRDQEYEDWVWNPKIDSPAAWLRKCASADDFDRNQATVLAFVDDWNAARKKELMLAREQTFRMLDMHAKTPESADVLTLLAELEHTHPVEFDGWALEWKARKEKSP